MTRRFALAGVLLAVFSSTASKTSEPSLAVGQRWSYEARPGEAESTLVIGRLEQHPSLGEVAHISVFGIRVKNPQSADGISKTLGHIPISVTSLRSSLLEFVRSGSPDENFEQGYAIWSEAVEDGKGGVFSIPVKNVVSYVEKTLNP